MTWHVQPSAVNVMRILIWAQYWLQNVTSLTNWELGKMGIPQKKLAKLGRCGYTSKNMKLLPTDFVWRTNQPTARGKNHRLWLKYFLHEGSQLAQNSALMPSIKCISNWYYQCKTNTYEQLLNFWNRCVDIFFKFLLLFWKFQAAEVFSLKMIPERVGLRSLTTSLWKIAFFLQNIRFKRHKTSSKFMLKNTCY